MKKTTFFFGMAILFIAVVTGSALIAARSSDDTPGDPSFNHFSLYVYDLDKTGNFYERVLKFRKIDEPFKDGKHLWFNIGPHNQLHLIAGNAKDQVHPKSNHLSLTVSSVEEFIEHLKKEKVSYTSGNDSGIVPTLRADGVKQVFFQDPDGFWIEVNNDRY